MPEYDRFNALLKSVRRKYAGDHESEVIEDIHNAFVSCIPDLPENLKHDIAYYFEDICSRVAAKDRISLLGAKLGEVLFLVEGEYDRVEETFDEAEWVYIKDVVDDFAMEIDQQRLTYIMRQIVSRGVLDQGDSN
jgi:hypothetical protein